MDPFQRYRFPSPQTRLLSDGRTEILNVPALARSLGRPVDCILAFLKYSLNTSVYEKKGRYYLQGHFSKLNLDDFIGTYVTCGVCTNPETVLIVKKRLLYTDCRACGAFIPLPEQNEMLVKFIVNHF